MEFTIGKSARSCRETERRFEHGERVYSLVRYVDSSYEREDYCEEAWQPERSAGATAVWSTQFYDASVAEQAPEESFSPMRQLFYEAAAQDGRVSAATAFLAAELLRRQKVFRRIKDADSNEEARITLYNDRIGNRLVEVRDPNLSLAELEEGRRAMLARLQELETEQPEDAAEAAPEAPETAPDEEANTDGGQHEAEQPVG